MISDEANVGGYFRSFFRPLVSGIGTESNPVCSTRLRNEPQLHVVAGSPLSVQLRWDAKNPYLTGLSIGLPQLTLLRSWVSGFLMFRRVIATWLIMSILGYGTVLAADVHGETGQTEHPAQILSDGDSQPEPMDQQADSDHCCHGAAHLLGFASQFAISVAMASSPPVVFRSERVPFRSSSPAFRPPIAT